MMNQTEIPRLYRSRQDRVFAGVAGGMAEYFKVDATLVRVILFLALLMAGPFAPVVYIVLAFIIPGQPVDETAAEATIISGQEMG
jgi:phage shock protein C